MTWAVVIFVETDEPHQHIIAQKPPTYGFFQEFLQLQLPESIY
jgi:hypothetical protein